MSFQNPVVVVPGITASQLRDEYPVEPDVVWSALLNKEFARITLHPDDRRYELQEPARVRANAVFELPYGELIDELRHNLTRSPDEPVPVYPFPYDWRMPLQETERQLSAFVDEVVARTKLMKHYHRAGYAGREARVDLVGHSMGGLVITGYLERKGPRAPVGKVVTLGTPFRGSFEAPIKIATGTASLGTEGSSSRERESARLTPALYHLLPRYEGALEVDAGLPGDLYRVNAWQRGVIRTLAQFLRLHGRKPAADPAAQEKAAESLLGDLLKVAREHRTRTDGFRLNRAGLDPSRWLCIIGVDCETRVGLRITKGPDGPEFDLGSDHRRNQWGKLPVARRVETGDGTVPYLGAKPSFLDVKNLVCVRPDDFGYWELGDKVLLGQVGLHGMLPKLNLAHRLIVSHLTGTPHRGTWGWPPPDLGGAAWKPPIPGLPAKEEKGKKKRRKKK